MGVTTSPPDALKSLMVQANAAMSLCFRLLFG